jgi:hypothetical protein
VTATATNWVQTVEIPEAPGEQDLRAFFGIPPDPEEELDANIRRKRRAWRSKVRERKASPAAEKKVAFALKLIDELERRLKRGVVDEEFDLEALREEFADAPESRVDELDDLWRVLEELLAAGRPDEALKVANDVRGRFPDEPQSHAGFAWIAAVASRSSSDATERMRQEGLAAAQAALAGGVETVDSYSWTAILQLDLEEFAAARRTLAMAARQLGELSPWLLSHRCEAHAGLGDIAAAGEDARAAVEQGGADSALRSNTVEALIAAMRAKLLPIDCDDSLRRYNDLVQLAAWCAVGVPEAEDRVRPYRLWAAQASSRAYVGSVPLRSLLAVASGFLLLPALNRSRSKPVWRVFVDGPERYGEISEVVVSSPIAGFVHEGLDHKLSWRS